MSTWAVLATGPSMSQEVAYAVRGRCKAVAVSDSYKIAPWADVLVSTDRAWWAAHPEALAMNCPKYGAFPSFNAMDGVMRFDAPSHTNSGLLGLLVAVSLGAKRVLLCGVDLRAPGDHFFGRHPVHLSSTTAARMQVFKRQFEYSKPLGVEVLNCSPSSALSVFPKVDLLKALNDV